MILSNQQLSTLKTAVENALLARGSFYDAAVRFLLARGIRPAFLLALPALPAPGLQLDLDLTSFNNVERLSDGTVPLEIWLRNALALLQAQQQAATVQEMLDLVSTRMSGAPPVTDPTAPNLPRGSLPEGLERQVHRDDTLPFAFVEGARRVGLSVAHLKIPEYELGQVKLNGVNPIIHMGTGWLVKPDLLMTNWHVVNARDDGAPPSAAADFDLQGRNLDAFFDFDDVSRPGTAYRASRCEAADQVLDYALVRLAQPVGDRVPLLLATAPLQVQSADDYLAVNIIQHPQGGPKRVAIRNNLVYRATYPMVSYFTDTHGGSSGSPVCTDDWRVVALHRAWKSVQGVQFQGKPTPWVNEGTQVAAILEHLAQNHPALHAEVTAPAPGAALGG
jgi:V8-like Glu-specific endopeptidase